MSRVGVHEVDHALVVSASWLGNSFYFPVIVVEAAVEKRI